VKCTNSATCQLQAATLIGQFIAGCHVYVCQEQLWLHIIRT